MRIRLRDLSQGALLHVVVALLAGPMKAEQIARKTGKSPESVQRALAVLDSEFRLVTAMADGRWPVWSIRDRSQIELPLPGLIAEPVDKPAVSGDETACLTPQISESPTGSLLINQLTRLGAHPNQAVRAINAALRRRESVIHISQRIAYLAQYTQDHRSIRNPGQWALGFITTGCDLPEDERTSASDYSGYRPYLASEEGEKGSEGE